MSTQVRRILGTSLVVQWLRLVRISQSWGPGFNLCSGKTRSCMSKLNMLQLKIPQVKTKIKDPATKILHSQINKYFKTKTFLKKKNFSLHQENFRLSGEIQIPWFSRKPNKMSSLKDIIPKKKLILSTYIDHCKKKFFNIKLAHCVPIPEVCGAQSITNEK